METAHDPSSTTALHRAPRRQRLARPLADRLLLSLLAVYGLLVLFALLFAPLHFLPAEDAVILHQYSRNLAQHGAITYYAGGPHTEGATEFGWMLLVAAALRCHVAPMPLTAAVNALSLLLLAWCLLRLAGIRPAAWRILALAGAAGLVPQIVAALAGFPVLPEALLLTCLVWAVVRCRYALAPLAALALCLLRPDAVLFAVPLLLLLVLDASDRRRAFLLAVLCFVLPGALYFVWRVHYFGELFPLPFLVKGQVHRSLGILVPHSFTQSLKYLLFDAALLVPVLRRGALPRALALALLLVPTLFFWTMRLDQNVGDRFFFYLPLGAALLIARCWPALLPSDRTLLLRFGALAALLILLAPLLREVRSFRDYQFRDVQAIATGLAGLPRRGTLLTSEAGFLAYDSGWIAVDAWGLNTARFARRLIQPGDVQRLHPDLIVLHPNHPGECNLGLSALPPADTRSWEGMVRNAARGARDVGTYQLWYLPYGSAFRHSRDHGQAGQGDEECFFVNTASPDLPGMVSLLVRHHARLASSSLPVAHPVQAHTQP